jgi:hypothetical protein
MDQFLMYIYWHAVSLDVSMYYCMCIREKGHFRRVVCEIANKDLILHATKKDPEFPSSLIQFYPSQSNPILAPFPVVQRNNLKSITPGTRWP